MPHHIARLVFTESLACMFVVYAITECDDCCLLQGVLVRRPSGGRSNNVVVGPSLDLFYFPDDVVLRPPAVHGVRQTALV